MKIYNKLVRDRIPKIIKESRKNCLVSLVEGEEKKEYLEKKLNEEVKEFLEDKNLEELADVMEVIFALGKELGYSEEEILKKRLEKRESRGGFEQGIILYKVYEE